MKNKILILGIVTTLIISLFVLTGCNNKSNQDAQVNNAEQNVEENTDNTPSKDVKNDNDSYYVILNGKKFAAGDKIADLLELGFSQDSRVVDEEVKTNTYMIGAGRIENSEGKTIFNVTPFNPTDSTVTVADCVIGGIEIGDYQYDKIPEDVLALDLEIVGGIKFGSSYEDIVKVFGETDDVYKAESLGYTVYTYDTEEVYRKYEFTIDKDGKLSEIRWQNLVFNK